MTVFREHSLSDLRPSSVGFGSYFGSDSAWILGRVRFALRRGGATGCAIPWPPKQTCTSRPQAFDTFAEKESGCFGSLALSALQERVGSYLRSGSHPPGLPRRHQRVFELKGALSWVPWPNQHGRLRPLKTSESTKWRIGACPMLLFLKLSAFRPKLAKARWPFQTRSPRGPGALRREIPHVHGRRCGRARQ